jgi:S-adenosylmethionine hydrolase
VAAHLASGVPLQALGEPVAAPQQLTLPRPKVARHEIRGQVLLIDHFGNLITNISEADLRQAASGNESAVRIDAGPVQIRGLARTFSDVAEGEAVAYLGSSARVEVAVRNGSAAEQLQIDRGEPVRLVLS